MEQHPIPQQISSYEFKLVGEMTIKQFGKAAGGIVIAVIINALPLVFLIKYPLMAVFGIGGLALAFVPYQDRPLETWLVSFIRSIYSPTIYLYKKKAEQNWLDIDLSKDYRKIKNEEQEKLANLPVKDEQKVKEFIESLPSVKREGESIETKEVVKIQVEKKKEEKKPELAKEEVVVRSENKEEKKEEVKEEPKVEDWRDQKADLNLKKEKLEATGQAVFGSIPMPDIPDSPNLIVGMVTDNTGKIIEDAIVEIQDQAGNPVRVLKTNPLGQFRSSTQMSNGTYLIITEKSGYNFDRVNINLKGEVVEPVKIIASNF